MSLKLLKSAAQMPYISVHAILSQKHPDLYFHFLAHPLLWAHCLRIFQICALKLNPHEVVFKGQALGDTRCREWNLMIRISVLIKEVPESCLALLPCDGRWATAVKEAVPHQHFICWHPGLRLPGLQSCEKFTSSQYKLSSLRPFYESNLNSLLPLLSPPSSFLPPPDLPSSLFRIQTFQSRLLRWAKSCSTGFVSLAYFIVTRCFPTPPIFLQTTPFYSSSLSDTWVPHFLYPSILWRTSRLVTELSCCE